MCIMTLNPVVTLAYFNMNRNVKMEALYLENCAAGACDATICLTPLPGGLMSHATYHTAVKINSLSAIKKKNKLGY